MTKLDKCPICWREIGWRHASEREDDAGACQCSIMHWHAADQIMVREDVCELTTMARTLYFAVGATKAAKAIREAGYTSCSPSQVYFLARLSRDVKFGAKRVTRTNELRGVLYSAAIALGVFLETDLVAARQLRGTQFTYRTTDSLYELVGPRFSMKINLTNGKKAVLQSNSARIDTRWVWGLLGKREI